MQFTFTTRDEYFQQKAQWFKEYEEQIANIRYLKLLYKTTQRKGGTLYEVMNKQGKAQDEMSALLSARAKSRAEACRQYLNQQVCI